MLRRLGALAILALLTANCMQRPTTAIPTPSTETRGEEAGWLDGGTWASQHQDILKLELDQRPPVVLLGDSLTQGWGGLGRKVRNPGQAAFDRQLAPLKAANFGIAGDGTQQVLWRVQNGALSTGTAKVVVLNVGTNNLSSAESADIVAGVRAILQEILKRAPIARVLVIGILPRGDASDPIRKKLFATNRGLASLTDARQVVYKDYTGAFVKDGGDLLPGLYESDKLHLNSAGYEAWAEWLAPDIKKLLEMPPLTPESGSAGPKP